MKIYLSSYVKPIHVKKDDVVVNKAHVQLKSSVRKIATGTEVFRPFSVNVVALSTKSHVKNIITQTSRAVKSRRTTQSHTKHVATGLNFAFISSPPATLSAKRLKSHISTISSKQNTMTNKVIIIPKHVKANAWYECNQSYVEVII